MKIRGKPLLSLALALGLFLMSAFPSSAALPNFVADWTPDRFPTQGFVDAQPNAIHMYPDTSNSSNRISTYTLPAYSGWESGVTDNEKVYTGESRVVLPPGYHWYEVTRKVGEWVPVEYWRVEWRKHYGEHYPTIVNPTVYSTCTVQQWETLTGNLTKGVWFDNGPMLYGVDMWPAGHGSLCHQEVSSGFVPYCALCGKQVVYMYHYTTKAAIKQVTHLRIGDKYISYCPYDGTTEQGAGIGEHLCVDPTPNRFYIQYNGGTEASNIKTKLQTNYYSPSMSVLYEGSSVDQDRLTVDNDVFKSTDCTFVGYSLTKGTTWKDTGSIIPANVNIYEYFCGNGTIDIQQNQIIDLWAVWKPIEKTLILNAGGGKFPQNGNAGTWTQTGAKGDTAAVVTPTAPTGYTVTLNGNGGKVPNSSGTATLSVPIPKAFSGWVPEPNPLSGIVDLDNGKYTFGSNGAYTDKLTATWQPGSYTLPSAYKAGYFFVGWYYDTSFTNMAGIAGQIIYPASNVTLYAKYDGVNLTGVGTWETKKIRYDWNAIGIANGAYTLKGSAANNASLSLQLNRSGTNQSLVSVDKTLTTGSFTPTVSGIYEITVNGGKGGNYSGFSGGAGGSLTYRQAYAANTTFTMNLILGGNTTDGQGAAGGNGTLLKIAGITAAIAAGGGGANKAAEGYDAQGVISGINGATIAGAVNGSQLVSTMKGADSTSGGGGGYRGGAGGITHNHVLAEGAVLYPQGVTNMQSECYDRISQTIKCSATYTAVFDGSAIDGSYRQLFYDAKHSIWGNNVCVSPSGQHVPNGPITDGHGPVGFTCTVCGLRVSATTAPSATYKDPLYGTIGIQFYFDGWFSYQGSTQISDWAQSVWSAYWASGRAQTFHTPNCDYHDTHLYELTCDKPEAAPSYGGSSFVANYIPNSVSYSTTSSTNSVRIKSLVTDYSTVTNYTRENAGDIDAPIDVKGNSMRSNDRTYFTVTWSASQDRGTNYNAQLTAVNLANFAESATSDAITTTQLSKLKGYFYKVDTSATASKPSLSGWQMNASWTPTSSTASGWTFTKSTSVKQMVANMQIGKTNYLHVFAVDNAGNTSAVANIPMVVNDPVVPNGYTLKFDKNSEYAIYTGDTTRTMTLGKTTTNTTNPTLTGYIFDGWYTEKVGGVRLFDTDGSTLTDGEHFDTLRQWIWTSTSTVTVYAHYVPVTADITLHRNGVTGSEASETYDLHYVYDGEHQMVDNVLNWTRIGYTMEGWALTQEKANSLPAINRTIDWETRTKIENSFVLAHAGTTTHLWAVWKPITYIIEWNDPWWEVYPDRPEGTGTRYVEKTYIYDEQHPTETQASTDMYHKGYYIGGWTSKYGENPQPSDNYWANEEDYRSIIGHYNILNELSSQGAKLVLDALWFPNHYKIVYHSNTATHNQNTGKNITSEETMEQEMMYDVEGLTYVCPWTRTVVASSSKFIGWSLDSDYAKVLTNPKTMKDFYHDVDNMYDEHQRIINLTAIRDEVIHLYAIFDDPPQIKTSNLTLTFDQIVNDTAADGTPIWSNNGDTVSEDALKQYILDHCILSVTDDAGGTLWQNGAFGKDLYGKTYTSFDNPNGLSMRISIDVQTIAYNSYYNRVTGYVISATAIDSVGQSTMATFTITVSEGYNIMVAAN